MATGDTHGLGYVRVDDDPNLSVLIATMDATARWEATLRLRAWERKHLRLHGDQRLLDVGCGLGEAAIALGEDLSEDGEVVGVDLSAEMLRVAATKAGTVTPDV
jgi:ubiquinone/menaquinone biosynthesis C-methylase UbiE